MPPIPAKLAKCIQEGLFVKMVKLMPDFLSGPNPSDENQLKSSKFKNWEITNIASGLDTVLQVIHNRSYHNLNKL